jgi:hypothetical protein
MKFKANLLSILLITTSLPLSSYAQDHGAPPAAAAPAGGEHGAAPAAAATSSDKESAGPAVPGRRLPEWSILFNRIAEMRAKIKEKEENLKKLIEIKHNVTGENLKPHLDWINHEYEELKRIIEEYDKSRALLKYRFPEKFINTERKYKRVKLDSLKNMEIQIGIDGHLEQTLQTMRSQFGIDKITQKKLEELRKKEEDPSQETEDINSKNESILFKK